MVPDEQPRQGLLLILWVLAGVVFGMILLGIYPRQVEGFAIERAFGGNCVTAQTPRVGDVILFCSSDIKQVEDALRRYKQSPLGNRIKR